MLFLFYSQKSDVEDDSEFKAKLDDFLFDKHQLELSFPASLSGYQRKCIHEVRIGIHVCIYVYNRQLNLHVDQFLLFFVLMFNSYVRNWV